MSDSNFDNVMQRAKLVAERKLARLLASPEYDHCHESFAVRDALLFAERFINAAYGNCWFRPSNITFGVEAMLVENGDPVSLQYLNTGDSYGLTLLYLDESEEFVLSSWGDIVESLPSESDDESEPDDDGEETGLAMFERFTLSITLEDASSGSHSGDCDDDVSELVKLDYIASQLDEIPADDIRDELAEYGAWDETELADDEANRKRIVWIACGNIRDDNR